MKPKGISPRESDVGRKVVYRIKPLYEPEEGVISSLGHIPGTVFVRYGGSSTAKCTRCHDLDYIGGD